MAKKINIRATKEYSEGFISALRGVPDHLLANRATLQADSDIGGGIFTASQTFIDKLIMALDADVVIQKATTVFQAAYNEDLGAPSLDGDISDFTFGGELTDSTEDTGIAFGARHLKVNKFNRKTVKISKQLLQSPRMDVEGIVVGRVNTALARTCERHYMTGTGDQEPLGLFIASADGITTARDVSTDNTATNITADGLINAQSQVRPVYQAKCGWVVSPTLIKNVRKLKDGTGVYIWAPGLQIGIPNTILGKAYIMSEYVPTTWTTGLYVGLYGDLSYYWIALGLGNMTVQRLLELYATTGQIGLLFDNLGVDAMPVLAEAFARVKLG